MPWNGNGWWRVVAAGCGAPLLAGCLHPFPSLLAPPRAEGVWVAAPLPREGVTPAGVEQAAAATEAIAADRQAVDASPPGGLTPPAATGPGKVEGGPRPAALAKPGFVLPPDLPGADAPPIRLPRFGKETAGEREKAVQSLYPALPPVPPEEPSPRGSDASALSLAELQAIAMQRSPTVRRARQDVEAARGAMVQAGLPPNPTAGYEADQWQPGPKPRHNSGQQGGYMQQLIKTAGKLQLAQAVAAFDVVKAEIAFRRAQVDLATAVRMNYFAVLVAEEAERVNRALVRVAGEVYRLQLRLVRGGEAAGYEPLQLYSQAMQAQNNLIQAQARHRYAWTELAATLNAPDMPPPPLAGRADGEVPPFDFEQAKARLLAVHTDLLTAEQNIEQARLNIRLAEKNRVPDLHTQVAFQHDNSTGNDQFNLQLGLNLPVWDKNQGRIYQAKAQLARSGEDLRARQNELVASLAEAFGRYESSRRLVANYREHILPNLARAYQGIQERYQQEPDRVSFNDIVVAQFNYAAALNAYLASLTTQWTAVVDVANLVQLEELSLPEAAAGARPSDVEVLPAVPPLPQK